MLTIEQAAHRVARRGGTDQEVFIDPATITVICAILSTLFSAMRLWCVWRNNKVDGQQIKEACARPGFRLRRRIYRVVRQHLSHEQYRQHGGQLVHAILAAGASASPAELEQLGNTYINRFGQVEQEL